MVFKCSLYVSLGFRPKFRQTSQRYDQSPDANETTLLGRYFLPNQWLVTEKEVDTSGLL